MLYFTRKDDDMATYTEVRHSEAVYCKLFSDTVTVKICDLRKQELNGRGGFSCQGCRTDKQSSDVTVCEVT